MMNKQHNTCLLEGVNSPCWFMKHKKSKIVEWNELEMSYEAKVFSIFKGHFSLDFSLMYFSLFPWSLRLCKLSGTYVCHVLFARHRNCPSRPDHSHQCMCETENDPDAATSQHQRWYNQSFSFFYSLYTITAWIWNKTLTVRVVDQAAHITLLALLFLHTTINKIHWTSGYFCLSHQ